MNYNSRGVMRYIFLTVFFSLIPLQSLFAQAPNIQWIKTFGGSGHEEGYDVQQTNDGGYIITGRNALGGLWLIKTDANGDTLWTKNIFGFGHSVRQTTDGGYIITGSLHGDVLLVKTNTNGDTIWTRTFNGHGVIAPSNDWGSSVDNTSDGGYIIAGRENSAGFFTGSSWLIKTNANGDSLWTRIFGSGDGASVRQTTDGGYVIAGYTLSTALDAWLIKTDENGDTLWTKTFGDSGQDIGYSVQQITDGGYVIAGGTESYGAGGYDAWLIKTDENGDTLWTKTFGDSGQDIGYSVQHNRHHWGFEYRIG
jgi:hypothetical protein